jgi:hypothetical protein
MSGWENIPEEQQAGAHARARRRRGAPLAEAPAPMATEELPAEEGDLVRLFEWYWPAIWVGMLGIIAFIGIYQAVDRMAGGPW